MGGWQNEKAQLWTRHNMHMKQLINRCGGQDDILGLQEWTPNPHLQIFVVMSKNKWFSKQLKNHNECLVVKEHQTTIVFLS
jgi:hypothetical protein